MIDESDVPQKLALSAIVTWLPHGVICYGAVRHCRRLRAGFGPSAWSSLGHLGVAAGAVVPCTLLFGLVIMVIAAPHGPSGRLLTSLPMTIVGAPLVFRTGLAFLPATYHWARRRLERDRALLAS